MKIAFVGGKLERKGGDLLIRWMREAGLELGCELHLITKSDVAASPGVHVHHGVAPNSAHLITLLRECHIFALPTRADCSPLALVEAMAVGLPVVSTEIAAIPEIIRHNETGILVKPDNYAELATALERLVFDEELRRRMGSAARSEAEDRFSLQNYERLIECVVQHTIA